LNPDKSLLLGAELDDLDKAAAYLEASLLRCADLLGRETWSAEELERLESLSSRFARTADLLTQRVMRLVDELELQSPGTLLDRIHRVEKRGWVEHADQLRRIRELRNMIAHEYAADQLAVLYSEIFKKAPQLLAIVTKAVVYGHDLIRRLREGEP